MFDFRGFFMMISQIAIFLSGIAVLLTPILLALTADWKYLYLYVPISIAFYLGSKMVKGGDDK